MSQELIDAAASGNIPEVTRLLDSNNTNINFVGKTGKVRENCTALVAAIHNQQWEVAKLLIVKGARFAEENCDEYSHPEGIYQNAYVYMCAIGLQNNTFDKNIFKMMISQVDILNPKFSGWGFFDIVKWLKRKDFSQSTLILSLLLHEAILRFEEETILTILDKSKININEKTFTDYLENRTLSPSQLFQANKALDFLVEKKILFRNDADKIYSVLNQHLKLELKSDGFPLDIQKYLAKPSQRSLKDLFCELQSWLYPEETLPRYSADSPSFESDSTNYNKTRESILAFQNLLNLRTFLDFEQTAILIRLNVSTNDQGENPAVLLLAEILLRYSAEKIKVGNNEEPLLNEQQQFKAQKIINLLYSLKESEKIILSACRQQTAAIIELTQVNKTLTEKIDEMDERSKKTEAALVAKIDEMGERSKRTEAMLEKLTRFLLEQDNVANTEKSMKFFPKTIKGNITP